MEHEMMEHSEILLYSDENGKEFVNVVFMDETFWLTQVGMAELFDSSKSNVSEHLSHIFDEEELDKASCMRKFGISEFSHSFIFSKFFFFIDILNMLIDC